MHRVYYSKELQYFATARTSVFGCVQEYPDASRRLCSSKDLSIEDQHKERVERKINFHLRLTIATRRPSTESFYRCAAQLSLRESGHRASAVCIGPGAVAHDRLLRIKKVAGTMTPASAYNALEAGSLAPKKPIPTHTKVRPPSGGLSLLRSQHPRFLDRPHSRRLCGLKL
jgi:hypothetical protein